MEFRFNVNEIFKQPIVEINSSLIPPGLSLADKRALWDAVTKVSDVVNTLGEASAAAQGLTKPITTSERLRNSEHRLYLLIDQSANNGKGEVTGMLKTGKKGLYVFDRDGHHYQVSPACVLDFYIHESKQRMGLGKKLFEHMLQKEHVEPVKMAVDRPSDKFLGFLNKHYGLNDPVKQMNNFVVYDGFFPEPKKEDGSENNNTPLEKSNQPANGLQSGVPYGRYGAPRPPCSMGQIIHNQSPLAQQAQEPAGTSLFIRAPTKTRSVYSEKPQQQTNSNGNAQTSQSMPNMPNYQNYNNQQQYQNQQQNNAMQMPYQTQSVSPNIQNQFVQSPNQQFQNSTQQYQNQPQQYQNEPQQYQDQRQQYQNQQQQNMYPQSTGQYPQYQYPPQQNYYQQTPQQNQFDPNAIQNAHLQQANMNQIQQQNQYPTNTMLSSQPQNIIQPQQYNTPTMQQPIQADSEIQLQRKKSVQFAPMGETMPQSYQPTQTQSAYDQRHMLPVQETQQKSLPNIPYQQQQQQNSTNDNINRPQNMQQINPNIQQNVQNASVTQLQQTPLQSIHNLPQQIYQHSPNSQQNFQPQQSQAEYQQIPFQTQSQQQPLYQQQQINQTQQYQQNIQGQVSEKQQPIQNNPVIIQDVSPSSQNITPQTQTVNPQQGYNMNQIHGTPSTVNQQNQQMYSSNQNAVPPNAYYQNMQNPPNPTNFPTTNQQTAITSQPMHNQNMTNFQQPAPPAQNTQMPPQMQYPQQSTTPQVYTPQSQQRLDSSKIIPPVEPINNQNKNYQYYDSNQNRMQSEYVKQVPGTNVPVTPNASGDMQPIAEQGSK